MKRFTIFFMLSVFCTASFGQKQNRTITDKKTRQLMLVGKCSRCGFEKGDFKPWFDKEYNEYQIDTKTLDQLAGQWRDVTITLVLGTWCSDSRREIPRFYKILDYVKFKKKHLRVICVDRDKKANGLDISDLDVKYVPTIIIYRGPAEMGRIIESPQETLEKDLFQFVGLAEEKRK